MLAQNAARTLPLLLPAAEGNGDRNTREAPEAELGRWELDGATTGSGVDTAAGLDGEPIRHTRWREGLCHGY